MLIIGNGGSASTATHFAEDLNKGAIKNLRNLSEKKFRAIPLTDISVLTAYGNDLCYEEVFAQQSINYLKKSNLEIVITASGNSLNIIRAIQVAKELRTYTFGLLGFDIGKDKNLLDHYILVRANKRDYYIAKDLHFYVCHKVIEYLCKTAE